LKGVLYTLSSELDPPLCEFKDPSSKLRSTISSHFAREQHPIEPSKLSHKQQDTFTCRLGYSAGVQGAINILLQICITYREPQARACMLQALADIEAQHVAEYEDLMTFWRENGREWKMWEGWQG
jgi:hypothetical protein